jgi:hypothetical protein
MKDYSERYIRFLERIVSEQRKDLKFLEGKCERLELTVMNSAPAAAPREYVARTDRPTVSQIEQLTPTHMPFRDLRRRWQSMSAEQQELAIKNGEWKIEEEDENAGS